MARGSNLRWSYFDIPLWPACDIFHYSFLWVVWHGYLRFICFDCCFLIYSRPIDSWSSFRVLWLCLLQDSCALVLFLLWLYWHIHVHALRCWLLGFFYQGCRVHRCCIWWWDFINIDDLWWMLFTFLWLYLCPGSNSGVSGSISQLCLLWWCHGGKI